MNKKIIILSGDPNSINSELIFKSWKKINSVTKKKIYFISNFNLLKKQFKKLNYRANLLKVKNIFDFPNDKRLKVVDINLKFKNPFGISKKSSAKFIKNSLDYAHNISLKNNVAGIINCPIDKTLFKKNKIGVTEYLAKKCNIKNNKEVMLIWNEKFSVTPITTHIDIREISKKINKNLIINKIKTLNWFFKEKFKRKPRIGIMGLNPHNAELRNDSEEKKIIIPLISKLKNLGISVKGPYVADTVFINEYKNFDVLVGMYHDQVLAPFKTIFKFNAINVTLGLKYLRVSPDHGTSKNIIGRNKANPISLIKCIKFVNKFGK